MKKLFLFLSAVILFSSITTSKAAAVAGDINTCGVWTSVDWDNWINSVLLNDIENRESKDIYTGLISAKNQCADNIKDLKIDDCFKRIEGYYKQFQGDYTDHIFSYTKTNQQYYDELPLDKMELPPEFKNATEGLPANWADIAKQKGWEWALFHSNLDERRLIFIIPQPEYTQYLLYFGYFDDPQFPRPYNGIQMQTVEYSRQGVELEKPAVHFRSWDFDGPNQLPRPAFPTDRCVSCHLSGPIAIGVEANPKIPATFSSGLTVETFNSKIVLRKKPDYSPFYDLANFPSDLKVGNKHNCTQCHGGSRNSLAFAHDSGKVDSFMIHKKVVSSKAMPPRASLPDSDRLQMVSDIEKDYTLQLKSWLTETKCLKAP